MFRAYTIRKVLGYLPHFLVFVYRNFPWARIVFLLAILTVILEYATLSLMLPLVGGAKTSSDISRLIGLFWDRMAAMLGLDGSPQTWMWI